MSINADKDRQIRLLMSLDAIRDTLDDESDPQPMFHAIARLLKETFEADACGIMLMSETSDEIETISAIGVPDETAEGLCRQAMGHQTHQPLHTSLWPYTTGAQILLTGPHPLGSFFLARKSRPFTAPDFALLDIAESQIDSAIMQARMVWKLAQRNRELEAIYQIDRLRDDVSDESTLISNFTNVLLEHYNATFCMIALTHLDNSDLLLRSLIDQHDIPPAALEAIRERAEDVRIPQVIPTPPEIDNLILMAAPFHVANERLGAVVVGRKRAFTIADHRLMYAITSQMDSAVVHSRTEQQLARRNRELEVIYRIDQIRDRETEFDIMLNSVLNELCHAISSEMGYIMLYSEEEEAQLELMAETQEGQLTSPEYYAIIESQSREALDKADLVYDNNPHGPIRSIVAVPLILNDQIIGVFGAVNNSSQRGFSAEDRRMLKAITSQVDTAVFERLERRRMRKVLGRSVDPKVLDALLHIADDSLLTGERVELSVLFADLRGSTEWAERTDPEELVHMLNTFLTRMTDVIFEFGGTLDKFVGDEVISLFGSPLPMQDHALRAAHAALEMQTVHQKLQQESAGQGIELPPLGIGVSSGEVIAGEIGPPIRTDFTAVGGVMNLGARLCGVAGPGEVLISPTTHTTLQDRVRVETLEPITLKGISRSIPIYRLLEIGG